MFQNYCENRLQYTYFLFLMTAWKGPNKNGAVPGWRCYAFFEESNDSSACINDEGEVTADDCSDPIYTTGKYCTRTEEMEALIENLKETGCPEVTTTSTTTKTTSTTTTTTTTTINCPEGFSGMVECIYYRL